MVIRQNRRRRWLIGMPNRRSPSPRTLGFPEHQKFAFLLNLADTHRVSICVALIGRAGYLGRRSPPLSAGTVPGNAFSGG